MKGRAVLGLVVAIAIVCVTVLLAMGKAVPDLFGYVVSTALGGLAGITVPDISTPVNSAGEPTPPAAGGASNG